MSFSHDRALIILFLHLEQMEKAGMPIAESLSTAAEETTDRKLRAAMEGVVHEVKQGASLSAAMGFFPRAFDETVLRLVDVGEKSGKLARAFGLCLDYVRKRDEHQRLMKKALRGPKISAAIILLLAALHNHTALPLTVAGIFAFMSLFMLCRQFSEGFRYLSDRLFLVLPTVGPFIAEDSWARFASSLSMLYAAGVDLRAGLKTAGEAAPNLVIRGAVEAAAARVQDGLSLHAAFRETGRMDRMALAMMKAGEDSGNLAHTLNELTEFYEKRADEALSAVQKLSGPVLTIITGIVLYFGLY
jgi:type II secretory pathway component PulF